MSELTNSIMQLEDNLVLDDLFDNLRLNLPNEYYPTSANYKFEDGTVIGKCLRAQWLEKKNIAKEKNNLRTKHIFEFGELIERFTIEKHKRLGIYWKEQVSFGWPIEYLSQKDKTYKQIIIRGRFDEIVMLGAKVVGNEIKSGSGQHFLRQHITGYKRGPRTKSQPHLINQLQSAPKPDNLLQVGIYLLYSKLELPKYINGITIDEWHLEYRATDTKLGAEYVITLEENGGLHKIRAKRIYVSANQETDEPLMDYDQLDLKTEEVDIELKDIYVEKIIERFIYLNELLEQNIVPECDYDLTKDDKGKSKDWQCDYCPYKYLCQNLPQQQFEGDYLGVFSTGIKPAITR
ncbi:MAG: hypothetical protein QXO21_06485 [Candidatus Anstonellales archaeon]